MSRKILATAVVTTVFAAFSAPAFAGNGGGTQQVEVDISGIDMTTDAGATIVMRKISRAADSACRVRSGPKPLSEMRTEKACVDAAIAGALKSITDERSRQALLHASKTG